MKKNKSKLKIDWSSKFIDLLIVILGITIAFQLNNVNESVKLNTQENDYLESFNEENRTNEVNLTPAIEYSIVKREKIDSLIQILHEKKYTHHRIRHLLTRLMSTPTFDPVETTMKSITSAGEIELIRNLELRNKLIDTYHSYSTGIVTEEMETKWVETYIVPFFFDNVYLYDFSYKNNDFLKEVQFENIVTGYRVLLNQKIEHYQEQQEQIWQLNQLLSIANKK